MEIDEMSKIAKHGFQIAGAKVARSATTGRFVSKAFTVNKRAPVTVVELSDENRALIRDAAEAAERRFRSSMKILA